MNIRDFVGPALLAVGLTMLFRSFWGWYQGPVADVGFVAPASKLEQEPLQLEVDFDDAQKQIPESLEVLETGHARYTFSNHGAVLKELEFTRVMGGKEQKFVTLGNPPALERETGSFLVALSERTPYYYQLKDRSETDTTISLIYQTTGHAGIIEKLFTVYKDKHQVDLTVTVTPTAGGSVRPRLLFANPYLQVLEQEEAIDALLIDKSGSFTKTAEGKLNLRAGFFAPELFGTQDKYFIHAMVKDDNKFTQRAYYKAVERRLLSLLEAGTVTEKTSWTLSFYCGPRELDTITAVAPKLDKALDYGFFSPIAKLMLYLLNAINRYVFNYGFAIILITLLLKLLLLPFTFKGQQKMKKAQDFSQKLQYLKQRYKNDPEGFKLAQEELIRKHGLPGLGGCVPLLLQAPIFIGLYSALNNSIELYRAPFVFWIQDLSMPDPYYVLPLLITMSVFLGSVAGQPGKMDFKQVFTAFALALFLGAWTSSMAAGLALFIFVNAFLHFVQTKAQQALGL